MENHQHTTVPSQEFVSLSADDDVVLVISDGDKISEVVRGSLHEIVPMVTDCNL